MEGQPGYPSYRAQQCRKSPNPSAPRLVPKTDSKATLDLFVDDASWADLERLSAVSQAESLAWLHALPSPVVGTLLDENSLRVVVSQRPTTAAQMEGMDLMVKSVGADAGAGLSSADRVAALPCDHYTHQKRDIIRRMYALLPYFDRDMTNTAFIYKMKNALAEMMDSEDHAVREAAYHVCVLLPIVFLAEYKDGWCLLERLHRALRIFRVASYKEKKDSLKILQNIQSVSQKVRLFALEVAGRQTMPATEARRVEVDAQRVGAGAGASHGMYSGLSWAVTRTTLPHHTWEPNNEESTSGFDSDKLVLIMSNGHSVAPAEAADKSKN